jgi:hypothetical protein
MPRTYQELLDLFYPHFGKGPVGPVGPAGAVPNLGPLAETPKKPQCTNGCLLSGTIDPRSVPRRK